MAKLVTVVIPVGPTHAVTGVYRDAEVSAYNQTVPVDVITVIDRDGNGAAWARNEGTRTATTPFVVYLDADDLLEPRFVELTAQHYRRGYYVYTDYRQENKRGVEWHITPDELDMHRKGQQHITTTLLPKAAWEMVGGFDESLPTLEDEGFYRAITAAGWCGIRCPHPLVVYRRKMGVSLVNPHAHDPDIIQNRLTEYEELFRGRFKDVIDMPCNCVGKNQNKTPIGEAREGDILATAHYSPMKKVGPATGRQYPRVGLGRTLWLDPRDAQARPDWWTPVNNDVVDQSPDPEQLRKAAQPKAAPPAQVRPNYARVIELAAR